MTSAFSVRRAAAAAVFALAAGCLVASAQARTLAKVDGVEITTEDVRVAAEDIGSGIPPELTGDQREAYVLDFLIDMKLAARKAEAEKVHEGADFARRMAYMRDKALMEGLLTRIAREANTATAVNEVYEQAAKAQDPEEEVRARHILVENEAQARAAIKRLRAGEDFARVADQISKDPGSKGGELGWFTKERMVPEFSEAAFKLKPGQLSEPVKSQFGWHVIKLEERRQKPFPPLAEVRDQVERYVVQKAQSEAVLKLREGARVERMGDGASPGGK